MLKVTFNDEGLQKLKRDLRELNKLQLTIGFQDRFGARRYESGINVSTVALFSEFGTKLAPQRAFLRSTFFENRDKVQKAMAQAVGRVVRGEEDPVPSLSQAGRELVALVVRKIDTSRGWARPNAPSTVAQKGFDYPLHDTDTMANSVSWAVRKNDAILALGQ